MGLDVRRVSFETREVFLDNVEMLVISGSWQVLYLVAELSVCVCNNTLCKCMFWMTSYNFSSSYSPSSSSSLLYKSPSPKSPTFLP